MPQIYGLCHKLMRCDHFRNQIFPWWKTEINIGILCHNLLQKCLLACRSLDSCSHETFTSPMEDRLNFLSMWFAHQGGRFYLAGLLLWGRAEKRHKFFQGPNFLSPMNPCLWPFWEHLGSVASTAGEHTCEEDESVCREQVLHVF